MIEVAAGIDENQICALYDLHSEWSVEHSSRPLNPEAWASTFKMLACSAAWVPFVAWDGDEPVGCVELFVQYDPMASALVCAGERAFVTKRRRNDGVFLALYEAIESVGIGLGADKLMIPAGVDESGKRLQDFYSRHGYEVTGVTMRKMVCHS